MSKEKKAEAQELWLPCKNCDGTTAHVVLAEIKDDRSNPDVSVWYYFQIVRCGGCKETSFRQNWQSSEDVTHDPYTGDFICDDHEDLYPSRIAGRKELKDIDKLPSKIHGLYRETHHALCHRLRVLAGIGIRGLVDAVCKEKKAAGRDLEQKIDDMAKQGWLPKEGAELLHGTRLLGNVAAHEAEPVSESELDAAMDVVEHLLKGVYIIPEKAKSFPKRKPKPVPSAPPAAGRP